MENKVRYCKKCGAELASSDHHSLCVNCRFKRNETAKKVLLSGFGFIGSAALFALTRGKFGGPKKS